MKNKSIYLLISILLLILLNSCGKESKNTWDIFVSNFVENYLEQNPDVAVMNGRHEFDGQISDYSDNGIKNRVEWFKRQKELVNVFDDNNLSDAQKLEKKNLLRVIDENLFLIETLRKPYNNASYYAWQLAPTIYLEKNYAPLNQRMKAYVKYLRSMKIAIEQIEKNFENEILLSSYHIEIAKIVFGGFADFMKTDASKGFENVKDEELWKNYNSATKEALNVLTVFIKWLNNQIPTAKDSFAIGSENFSKMLYATDRLNIPLLELIKLAENDLNKNLAALKKACQVYSPGQSVEESIKMIQSQKKEYDPIEKAREQLPILEKFIKDKNIVTVPNYEKLSVVETPSFGRGYYSAAMVTPNAFDKNMEGFYYITPPDPKWPVEKRKAFLLEENILCNTSVHEVWPGHFLQSLYFNKNKSLLAKIFVNYTNNEGWAHYCEEMMFEEGLGNYKPEYEIAIRSDALLRNVRFLSAIKMHTEGMTVKDAKRLFINYAFQDSVTASQEALRGTYDPQYYGYTLGKILIRKLKNDWMNKTGVHKINEFHEKFLSYGGIPISLIEASMMGNNN